MNIKIVKAAFAGLILAISSVANAGLLSFDGIIVDDTEVDHWFFTVTNSGTFTFDVLAYEDDGTDFFANGIDNDQLDSYIYLFANNASGALIGSDDDGGDGTDGSLSSVDLDSLMSFDLNIGSYLFVIGSYDLSELDARNGFNTDNSGDRAGSYRVTVSSATGTAQINSVPEPSTIAIFALGIMGLASRRLKK